MTDVSASAPAVARLVHRLAECPDDFLAPPVIGGRGVVSVAAVVGDTLAPLGAGVPDDWVNSLAPAAADAAMENWLRACLVSCWLVSDPSVRGLLSPDGFLRFLGEDVWPMAALVRADLLVRDADRREELARLVFRRAGVVPDGETVERAADRLSTLDSVTRVRVEGEARAAEQRAAEVRAALARQRAQEAAARASRE
jgi:hypothetical protein